jgi:hypothetical protein
MSNFLIDEDTDLLAAEFVLGTLDSEERANAQSLLRTDHGFIAMVRIWERRFGELHLMVEPVEPDAKLSERIKAKIVEIAPSEPTPEGKPPVEASPSPAAPVATDAPAAIPEVPKPADAVTAETGEGEGEGTAPAGLPADGTTSKPPEPSATGESETLAAVPTPAVVPGASDAHAATVPSLELHPLETVAKPENGATTQAPIPVPASPLAEPADQRPDLEVAESGSGQSAEPGSGRSLDRRAESTPGLIRSRRRWRALGVVMTLLVVGLGAMLAAWRFAPDRLPARLQPREVMMSLGIEARSRLAPVHKPAPPESQFDE